MEWMEWSDSIRRPNSATVRFVVCRVAIQYIRTQVKNPNKKQMFRFLVNNNNNNNSNSNNNSLLKLLMK